MPKWWQKHDNSKDKDKDKGKDTSKSLKVNAMTETKEKGTDWVFRISTDISYMSTNLTNKKNILILNSGAMSHFSSDHDWFTNYRPIKPQSYKSVDGYEFSVIRKGDIELTILTPNRDNINLCLKDILYAPNMPFGLISVSHLVNTKFNTRFRPKGCNLISPDGETCLTIRQCGQLWPFTYNKKGEVSNILVTGLRPKMGMVSLIRMTLTELHKQMGYYYFKTLLKMV